MLRSSTSHFVVNDAENIFLGMRSKALSKRLAVGLGMRIDDLRSDWRIITVRANADEPICYVMTLAEIRASAKQDRNGGAWWLDPPAYDRDEFREAWGRIVATT
ncbi:MAG: hypothetical protein DI623_14210 [Sphingomonas sanxanigenens]|uniref:Uncharacterized protein n=1 Tax=Sphingomonas sanxanigenens TaxID=397260 RepID=A0A2W5A375_9SPHN|nr:MAG: hypothetical protein DI623_14210 [Sphingomonas sanxanigenens]